MRCSGRCPESQRQDRAIGNGASSETKKRDRYRTRPKYGIAPVVESDQLRQELGAQPAAVTRDSVDGQLNVLVGRHAAIRDANAVQRRK